MIRGKVVGIKDPEGRGRIKVSVPSVDDFERWAEPCFLPQIVALPKVGDVVWILMEEGDKESLVWMGCLYSNATFKALRSGLKDTDISVAKSSDLITGKVKSVELNATGSVKAKDATLTEEVKAGEVTVSGVKVALVGGGVAVDVPSGTGTIKPR